MQQASFEIDKTTFLKYLTFVKGSLKATSKNARKTVCEITITDGLVKLASPGALFEMPCVTRGTCKFTISVLYLNDIIKTNKEEEIKIIVGEKSITLGKLTVPVQAIFFEDDTVLRTIDLPLNFTDADLLRLNRSVYTAEELAFNKLEKKIAKASEALDTNMMKAESLLKKYGVNYADVVLMVNSKLYR